jgi:branched-chain amino acid transport system permease protein
MTFYLQMAVNSLQLGSFYALIALGYSMVYGILLLYNFAHGDVFMTGAYIGFFIATFLLGISSAGVLPLPGWALLALTIGYRPLRKAPRASAAITGLMIGIILETGNLALLGAQRRNFPALITTTTYKVAGLSITNTKIMIVLFSLLIMLALHFFVRRSKWGMAMRAMAYDFVVVPLMGISINRIAALTFGIAAALAAVAGVFFGQAYPVLEPYMGILYGWKSFVAAILGGRGSIPGAVLAGFLLAFLEVFVVAIFPSTVRDFIAYSIILLILTFRPHGFFGEPYTARMRL